MARRLAILVAACWSVIATAEQDPFREGIALLQRAADALGGEQKIRSLEGVSYDFSGPVLNRYQGPTPDQAVTAHVDESASFDFVKQRAHLASETRWGDTGFGFDRIVAVDEGDWSAFFREMRRSPHLVLRHALLDPSSVRALDRDTVTLDFLGRTLDLDLDPAGLPKRTRFWFDDTRHGDAPVETEYGDYHEVDGWMVPGRIRQLEAGTEVFDEAFVAYRVSADVASPPTDQQQRAPGSQGVPTPEAIELAPAVTLFTRVGGADYHAMVVETQRGLLVVEAPLSPTDGRDLRRRILDHYSIDSIAAATVTHHHADHAGGLPGLVDAGTRVHVPAGEHPYFSDMLTSPRHLLGWDYEPVQPVFGSEKAFVVKGGGSARIVDIGTSHADHHAIVVVEPSSGEGVIFQGDMVVFTADGGVEPARDQGCELAAALKNLDIGVRKIAGAHGRVGTPADLERAIAAREHPCPG